MILIMEFLPVLEPLDKPKEGLCRYSLIPRGSAPGVSVGHTCTFTPSGEGEKGRVLIVGGANPSGSFSHSHIINLDNHEWDIPEWDGLKPRYEHCSFVPESYPHRFWVFGGAQQTGNRNCIQNIQLTDSGSHWKNTSVNGMPPCPRTYHTNSACHGDRLYVFSGGEAGAAPVSDQKLHVFDAGSMKWEKVHPKGDIPPGVTSHSAVVLGKNIYIFGGMTADGASNSMYRFNTDKSRWFLMKFQGDMPPNRLDHSMCLLPWKVCGEGDRDEEQANSPAASQTIHLAFVFGGMDTQGVIYNDCIVTVLT
uniref:rab9 effector protein with kelch motifs isoform X7 n=1 Tax=Monopterus albus TaxID=43700 RepID=UPI0009B37158|nr:rab9 effector protein with kelch motifs isoform X7 [Monopterus albus]